LRSEVRAYDLAVCRVQFVAGIVLSLICAGAAVAAAPQQLPTLGSARYAKIIGGATRTRNSGT